MEWKVGKKLLASISAMVVTSTSLGLQNIPNAVNAASSQIDEHSHQQTDNITDIHDYECEHDHEHDLVNSNEHDHVKVALLDSGVTDYQTSRSVSFVDDDTVDNSHGNDMMNILMSNTEHIDVYDVRVLDDNGNGTISDVASGIIWSVSNDADIILICFAGNDNSYLYKEALEYAEVNDVIVIAAAGNNSSAEPHYPSAFPTVISVGALEDESCIWEYSNYGDYVDTYEISSNGTSGAAAAFAGKTAAMIAEDPSYTPDIVRNNLTAAKPAMDFSQDLNEDSLVVASACSHRFNGSFSTKVKETCTTDGTQEAKCTLCGAVLYTRTVKATGHTWGSWITLVSATCTTNGVQKRTCSKCKGSESGTISKKNHSMGSWSTTKSATCSSTGTRVQKCTRSGCTYSVTESIAKTSHSFNGSFTTSVEATCTTTGTKVGKCSNCGTPVSTQTYGPLGHSMGSWSTTKSATCSSTGTRVQKCTRSGCTHSVTESIPATGQHTFNGSYSTINPTCTTDGKKEGKCITCGKVLSSTILEKLGHDLGTATITKAATCSTAGTKVSKCTRSGCTHSVTESIPATGLHTFNGSYSTTKEPTCTEEGLKEGKCTVCGKTVSSVKLDMIAHDYKTYNVVKEATCTEDGAKLVECSVCGDKKTETIKATGNHTFNGSYITTKEPTCTEKGEKVGKCTKCGEVVSRVEIDPLGGSHSFNGSYATVKEPTCTEEGLKEGRCTKCGVVVSSVKLEKIAHAYKTYNIIEEATCEKNGAKLVECSVCGDKKTETIIAPGHTFNGSYTTTKEPTCTEKGEKVGKCTKCGEVVSRVEIDSLGGSHSFNGSYATVKEPTCTEEGLKEGKCTKCGVVVSSVKLEKIAHDYKTYNIIEEATCEKNGAKLVECSVCGDKKTETIIAPGHTFNGSFETEKEPTCTEEGLRVGKCTKCGDVVTSSAIEPLKHDYKTYNIIEEATCEENGAKLVKCSRCENITTEIIEKTGHEFNGSFDIVIPSTCTEEGYKEARCVKCNKVLNGAVTEALGHDYIKIMTPREATCLEDGAKLLECKRCGARKTEIIHAIGHKFNGSYTTTIEPNCRRYGFKEGRCTVCEEVLNTIRLDPTEHDYGNWIDLVYPTCTTFGISIRRCNYCSNVDVDKRSPLGHKFNGSYTTTKEPTCTDEGLMEGKCTECGDTVSTKPIPARDEEHQFNGSFVTNIEPTCTSVGERVGHCTKCGQIVTRSAIPKTEHDYGVWTIGQEGTCTRPGYKYRICKNCPQREYQSILIPGHKFDGSFEIIEPTCTEDGARIGKCTRCGKVITKTVIEKLGGSHDFSGSFTVTKEPTCIEEGIRSALCKKCGVALQETAIPMVDHTWGEWEVIRKPTSALYGLLQRKCKMCETVEEKKIAETSELTVEDCGYESFYFRVNGDLDGGYSWPLYATETDEYTGEVIGRSYLRLQFTTNVDWTVSASSNIHVVDYDGNPQYSGTAGDNCILVYMDEIPLYKETNDIIGPFNLTISANEKSVSYPIYQVSQRFYNGNYREDFVKSMDSYIKLIGGITDPDRIKDAKEVLDVLRANKLTGDDFAVCQINDFEYFAIRSYASAHNEVTIKYMKYKVVIDIEKNNTFALLGVSESSGLMITQDGNPLFSTNGTINSGFVDSVDQVYEKKVAAGEKVIWGVSTATSFGLSFIEATPVVGFFIGIAVDATIDLVGHAIIKHNVINNGENGAQTMTTYTLSENCVLKEDNQISIICDNNDFNTTLVQLNFVVTDGSATKSLTVSKES